MKLFIFIILTLKPEYFENIYMLEKKPLDSALITIYKGQLTTPDSTIMDYAITLSSKKVSGYSFKEFLRKMPEIQRALPYIDSIFILYEKHFSVYDSLLYNYLRLSLFMLPEDKINKKLIAFFNKYKNNKNLVNVLIFFASRYNAKDALNKILSSIDSKFEQLDSHVLLTLAQNLLEKHNLTRLKLILKTLSKKSLKYNEKIQYYRIKGLYFESINNVDSALFYLILYTEMSQELDLNISRHLVSLYIKKGLFEEAKKTLLPLISMSPFDAELRKQAGYVYLATQKYDSSLLEYLIAKSLLKNDPEVHYYIARVLVRKKLYKDALSSINKAIKIENKYSYQLLKAFILFKLGYFDEAARVLLVIKRYARSDPYYYYLAGLVLKSMERKKLAYRYLLKSVSLDSTKPLRYLPLLSLAADFGDTSLLITALTKVKNLRLTDKDDIFDVAYAAQIINDTLLADSLYNLLLKMDPENPLYLNNLGYMWLENGNLKKAEKYIEKAYTLKPDDPYIIDSYAWLLFKQGRIKEAYILSKKAVKLAGKDPDIKRHYLIIKKAYNAQK